MDTGITKRNTDESELSRQRRCYWRRAIQCVTQCLVVEQESVLLRELELAGGDAWLVEAESDGLATVSQDENDNCQPTYVKRTDRLSGDNRSF